jgi:4-hydroxy-2-oxoheptanedioate aldolase
MFKARLLERSQQIGLFSTLNSPALVELLAGWDFDWILIDTEHSPSEMADIIAMLQALHSHQVSAIVRPAWSDMVLIKRVLDAGAQSLLIPCIETAEDARAAVSYTRYPPFGVRGVSGSSRAASYGQTNDYLQTAANEIAILVQIETVKGLDNLEDIAAVPGVDGVFIGPADLAASLGYLGNGQHPVVQAAVNDAFRRLTAIDKPTGYLTLHEPEAQARIAAGVEVLGVATDTSIINRGAALTLEGLHRAGDTREVV